MFDGQVIPGDPVRAEDINRMQRRMSNISGDNCISDSEGVHHAGRISRGGGTKIRIAICKENAPTGNMIHCNLRDENTGIEITTGAEGVDYNVEVYCKISGGTALNTAAPRLEDDDEIDVHEEVYDNSGTPAKRWTACNIFAGTTDCVCNT